MVRWLGGSLVYHGGVNLAVELAGALESLMSHHARCLAHPPMMPHMFLTSRTLQMAVGSECPSRLSLCLSSLCGVVGEGWVVVLGGGDGDQGGFSSVLSVCEGRMLSLHHLNW